MMHYVYLVDNERRYYLAKQDTCQLLKCHERAVYLGIGMVGGYIEMPKLIKRKRIMQKHISVTDKSICCYCERKLTTHNHKLSTHATKEHIIPKSKGGKRTAPCCHRCNSCRKNLPLKDFLTIMVSLNYLGVQERLTIVENIERFMGLFPNA